LAVRQHDSAAIPEIDFIVDPSGQTLYDLLQVLPNADPAVVQAAYRALARVNHPDVSGEAGSDEMMRRLNEAYALLSDPRSRQTYDLKLRAAGQVALTGPTLSVRRRTSCWRCGQALDAYTAYCGECHWLRCQACSTCGCENPEWLARQPRPRPGLPVMLGWPVASVLAVVLALVLLFRPGRELTSREAPQPPAASGAAAAVAPLEALRTEAPRTEAPPLAPTDPMALPAGPTPLPALTVSAPQPTQPPAPTQAPTLVPTAVPTFAPTTVPTAPPSPSAQPTSPPATAAPTAAPTTAPAAEPAAPPTKRGGPVATGGPGARLRAAPTTSSETLVVLKDETPVVDLGESRQAEGRTWVHVRANSGQEGWLDVTVLEGF
jgi:hypothetical protein